ncbi:aldose 1-epimerase [Ktedonobacteria bacterium brp13]|nr:aldose 1-epimerase [Ktedonobacteria bacterium brp13]
MTNTASSQPHEIILTHGKTQLGVIPEICLVSRFQVADWPVLYRPPETGNIRRWGIPLMIPNFSRLKNGLFVEKNTHLPVHGFGRELPWTITGQDTASITLQLTSNEQTRPQYPYEFTFTAQIAVTAETLLYTLSMENRNDVVMPIAPGFHPYFSVAQQDKPRIVVHGLEIDPARIDWDTQPPNDPYPFPHHVSLEIPQHGVITIEEKPIDNHYSLTTMQVWSEPVSAPDHNFVCFEPVVTSEDGLNRPADRLNIPPQTTHTLQLEINVKPN